MTKQEELQTLNNKWKEECKCELKATATQAVPGDGNADAEIVFIGEAPGKKEDELGIPFVGAAGKFLDEMLGLINLKREEIYITNIVKYRPPNNRDPLPEEKSSCREWLLDELKIISPKLIIFSSSKSHSRQLLFSSGRGSRLFGGRYLTMLVMYTSSLFRLINPSISSRNFPA